VNNFPHRKIVLADLTAFLLTFIEVFGRPLVEFASVIDREGQLVLEPSNSEISVEHFIGQTPLNYDGNESERIKATHKHLKIITPEKSSEMGVKNAEIHKPLTR
jgi:hypothetical protein